jgi:L-amino acid N-acyltransferase YncA
LTTPPDEQPKLLTRLATVDDAAAIRDIYNLEVTTSIVNFDLVPRSLEDQRRWLSDRSGAHAVIVAEEMVDRGDGTGARPVIVGYAALSPWRVRPAYSTSVEDSVYVHRDHQGRGVGKMLLHDLLEVATAHGFHSVFARIVDGHGASISLHQALDFEHVGTEREVGRKFNRWLDVVLMQRLLQD